MTETVPPADDYFAHMHAVVNGIASPHGKGVPRPPQPLYGPKKKPRKIVHHYPGGNWLAHTAPQDD